MFTLLLVIITNLILNLQFFFDIYNIKWQMHYLNMDNLWSNFMDRAELGNKHLCSSCGTKFYDLQKEIPVCPKCGEEIIIKVKPRLGRPPLNKNALNIQKVDKVEEKVSEEIIDKDEDNIESEMEDLISIDDIDENIIDEDSNIEIDEDENNTDNLEDIADIEIVDKEEDTDI